MSSLAAMWILDTFIKRSHLPRDTLHAPHSFLVCWISIYITVVALGNSILFKSRSVRH